MGKLSCLHRLALRLRTRLRLAEAAIGSLPADQAADLRAEMDLVHPVIAAFSRTAWTPVAAAGCRAGLCLRQGGHFHPFILGRAADVGSFRAIRVFDFDDALRLAAVGTPIPSADLRGAEPLAYGYCFAAIAANEATRRRRR